MVLDTAEQVAGQPARLDRMLVLRGKACRNAGRVGHDVPGKHAAVGRRLGHPRVQQCERAGQRKAR